MYVQFIYCPLRGFLEVNRDAKNTTDEQQYENRREHTYQQYFPNFAWSVCLGIHLPIPSLSLPIVLLPLVIHIYTKSIGCLLVHLLN